MKAWPAAAGAEAETTSIRSTWAPARLGGREEERAARWWPRPLEACGRRRVGGWCAMARGGVGSVLLLPTSFFCVVSFTSSAVFLPSLSSPFPFFSYPLFLFSYPLFLLVLSVFFFRSTCSFRPPFSRFILLALFFSVVRGREVWPPCGLVIPEMDSGSRARDLMPLMVLCFVSSDGLCRPLLCGVVVGWSGGRTAGPERAAERSRLPHCQHCLLLVKSSQCSNPAFSSCAPSQVFRVSRGAWG